VQSRWLEWVHSSRVNNICFLFHFSDVVRGLIDCGGIKNTYFIRTKEEGVNEGELRYAPLQEHDHISFFSGNGMTYSERIWCSLKPILQKKIFCRMAAGQSLNEKSHYQITTEFWSYFTFNLSGSPVNTKVSKGSNYVCWANLSVETTSVKARVSFYSHHYKGPFD